MIGRLALALLLVGASAIARAQELPDPDTEAAHRHYLRGEAEYAAGRYEEALKEFELGQSLRPLPAFDYDIGRCLDRLEHWREAAEAYRRYLDARPKVSDLDEVRARVRVLEQRAGLVEAPAKAPEPAQLVARPSLTQQAPKRDRSMRSAAIGVGVAALATGVVAAGVLGSVASGYADAQSMCRARPCGPADWSSLEARADAGYALVAVAGVAALVDVALIVRAARRR